MFIMKRPLLPLFPLKYKVGLNFLKINKFITVITSLSNIKNFLSLNIFDLKILNLTTTGFCKYYEQQ